jgi:hypothetical protein
MRCACARIHMSFSSTTTCREELRITRFGHLVSVVSGADRKVRAAAF